MRLESVYYYSTREYCAGVLFMLLKARTAEQNISHKEMPTYEDHLAFVDSRPYTAWYLILNESNTDVGACYLSKQNEIGVFIFKVFQGRGYATWATQEIMRLHPRPRYLANINPANEAHTKMFTGLGFKHIQNTYELVP